MQVPKAPFRRANEGATLLAIRFWQSEAPARSLLLPLSVVKNGSRMRLLRSLRIPLLSPIFLE